jgi:hypothetical protein
MKLYKPLSNYTYGGNALFFVFLTIAWHMLSGLLVLVLMQLFGIQLFGVNPDFPRWHEILLLVVAITWVAVPVYGALLSVVGIIRDKKRVKSVVALFFNAIFFVAYVSILIDPYLPKTPTDVVMQKQFWVVSVDIYAQDGSETQYGYFANGTGLYKNISGSDTINEQAKLTLSDKIGLEEMAQEATIHAENFPCRECYPGPGYYRIAFAPAEGGRIEFVCPIASNAPEAVACQEFSLRYIQALDGIMDR